MTASAAAPIATVANPNAATGETNVQSRPVTPEAIRSPTDWIAASRPNAEPRNSVGASDATEACWAVSTAPIPTPAAMNAAPSTITSGPATANVAYDNPKSAMPPRRTRRAPNVSARRPAGNDATVAATL